MITTFLLATIILLVGFAYLKIRKAHSFWAKMGVKNLPPNIIFGHNAGTVLRKMSFTDLILKHYRAFPTTRYSGIYTFATPCLLLKDPDLIKQITVKDFDHFMDHRPLLPEDVNAVFSKNLFSLQGKKWRDMRTTLSPAFTSSKMKILFTLINESAEGFVKYFQEYPEETQSVEMKDVLSRFTTDVIATCAFGIKCDSLREKLNDFYVMGKDLTSFEKISKALAFFAYLAMPAVAKLLNVQIFSSKVTKFFKDIVTSTIREREEKGIKRPDMINILMEAKKGRLKHEDDSEEQNHQDKAPITDDDIAGQATIFFFAGFETVSTCMSFMAYELSANPDIQKKLQDEIDKTWNECDGKLTYEALLKMKYMDQVISETLRKWPPIVAMDRMCTKPYTIPPVYPDEKPVNLKIDDMAWLPMIGLHRDPKLFPNPELFDPERFNDENKDKIIPYSYIPFGAGPRVCIGSRFALLEVKAMFFHLLKKFEMAIHEKTQLPIKISKKDLNLKAEGGIWMKLVERE